MYVFLIAELISFGAALLLLVAAFRVSAKWGLLTMFVPFGALVFACKYWAEGGARFLVCVLSSVVCTGVFLTQPEVFIPYLQQYPPLVAALQNSPFAAPTPPPPPDKLQKREAVDVADAETALSQRDNLLIQQTAYAKHVAELNATYAQLKTTRAKLKGGGSALAAYNTKAARYQENLQNLQAEKGRIDSLQRTVAAASAAANATMQTVANVGQGVAASGKSSDTPATRAEMDAAVQRVQAIVNQVPPTVIKPPEAESWNYLFHPGATKPDFDKTDIVSGRELWPHDYIDMQGVPNVFYRGADCEFNSQTKFFYTNRSLPKKRLTDAEYQELVRLYRFLGKCQRDLNVTL